MFLRAMSRFRFFEDAMTALSNVQDGTVIIAATEIERDERSTIFRSATSHRASQKGRPGVTPDGLLCDCRLELRFRRDEQRLQ
jgi:hypothetical protein